MRFLYWNLGKRRIEDLICKIVNREKIDVIILSECDLDFTRMLKVLNEGRDNRYDLENSPIGEPAIITNLPFDSVKLISDGGYMAARKLIPPLGDPMNIFVVHLPSKMYQDTDNQSQLAARWARIIEETERIEGHKRSIVTGDFNMNPFESGIISSEGFHAVMTKRIARKFSRTVAKEERSYFYNPMWSHFGEYPESVPGTYYYQGTTPIVYFWNIFDQVLVRPDLIDSFIESELRILTSADDVSLIRKDGIPDQVHSSDHLPIIFEIDTLKGI
jgi:hypothetical protein